MKLMWRRKGLVSLLLGGCLLALLSGCSGKADVTGKWNGKMTLPETGKSLNNLEFDLTQKGAQITGAMIFTKVDGGRVSLNGTRTGADIKFKTEFKGGLSVSFSGSIKSGSLIAGTALLVYSDPHVPVRQDRVTLELSRK